jgi:hypothetical protein
MATRDEPLEPQEVLEAAEAAHLAARHTVPISRTPTRRAPAAEPAAPKRRVRAPVALAAAVATGWAAVVSLAPVALVVMLLYAAEPGPLAAAGPVRIAAAGWLLAHGVPLDTPVGPVGLAPLALSALAAWRVARAGVHVSRAMRAHTPGRALVAALAVAIGYAVIGALVGKLAGGPGWGAPPVRAGLTLAGFGFVAAGFGALRSTGVLAGWSQRIPPVVRDGLRGGLIAAVGMLAAGAVAAGAAVAANGGAAADVLAVYRTGVAGQAGIVLLCLAYAPNFAIWSAAYLVGPGFAVGEATVVRAGEVTLGPLPAALPAFAGLPAGPMPGLGAAMLAVPVLVGAIAGRVAAASARGWNRMAAAVLTGMVAGGLLGLAAAVSAGPLGGGRLASIGPAPLAVAAYSSVLIVLGALIGAALMPNGKEQMLSG